jgi:hypothetical protein
MHTHTKPVGSKPSVCSEPRATNELSTAPIDYPAAVIAYSAMAPTTSLSDN